MKLAEIAELLRQKFGEEKMIELICSAISINELKTLCL